MKKFRLTKEIKYNHIIKRFSQGGGKKILEKTSESLKNNIPKTTSPTSSHIPKIKAKPKENTKFEQIPNQSDPKPILKTPCVNEPKNIFPYQKSANNTEEGPTLPKIFGKESSSYDLKMIAINLNIIATNLNIIAINLKPKNNIKTPEEKHICLGEEKSDDSVEMSSYLTSSAAHSTQKHDDGKPQNIKINNKKFNGSYVPEREKIRGSYDHGNEILTKREKRISAPDNEDGGGQAVPSNTKGGQFIRKLSPKKNIRRIKSNQLYSEKRRHP